MQIKEDGINKELKWSVRMVNLAKNFEIRNFSITFQRLEENKFSLFCVSLKNIESGSNLNKVIIVKKTFFKKLNKEKFDKRKPSLLK